MMTWARISRVEDIPEDMVDLAQEYHDEAG